ncbi:Endonuclease/exonuclease/phosphatase [Microdochium bolleyi]|uniref:Endonuclease/exonuclease/phosphatase n=1 Tax=Microdochium bolleyi TaxID=196109 RepID=A0A136JJ54_9PEZI|nr:Endonuclease/exonuclease/phosphatase [Microdochium bolleyi]
MEDLFSRAVAANEAARKTSVPWQPDVPFPQAHYSFDSMSETWHPHESSQQQQGNAATPSSTGSREVTRIALYAWNIDFMLPFPEERMAAALGYLESLITASPSQNTGVIIFLQECLVSDLRTIGQSSWVRDNFTITDVDGAMWASGNYGTTTLVSKNLLLQGSFRVHYDKTRMERDVLFVDVDVGPGGSGNEGGRDIIRVGNTHLESMAFEPAYRPPQVELAARFMKSLSDNEHQQAEGKIIHGALLAGDFNAIQDFDRSLHLDNGLRDAYLELGGQEDSEEGYTWGQQAATVLRDRFGCSRMDKVYFCGGGLRLRRFQTFGEGVELQDREQRRQLIELGFDKPWITDHLGVMAEFDVCE